MNATNYKGLDHMTNVEIIQYALEVGIDADHIELSSSGNLMNRDEVVKRIIDTELNVLWKEECDPAGGYGIYSHI